MRRYEKQRRERNRLRFSAMGKASQRVQQAKRDADMDERIRYLAEIEIQNLPRYEGDAIGCLQWHDFRTGKVRRWTIRIGDRIDRITAESNGIKTKSHGWSWFFTQLRTKIING